MHARSARRRLPRLLASAAMILPILVGSACTPLGDSSAVSGRDPGEVELTIFWWGTDSRTQQTKKALNLYQARHPGVTFKILTQGSTGYLDRLAVQAAAGKPVDIFQIDSDALPQYAGRDFTKDLTPYTRSGRIDLSGMAADLARSGVVGGEQVGVPAAETTPGLAYNKTLLAAIGAPPPQAGWSWDRLIEWAASVTAKTKGKVYGTMDASADYRALWTWLRQQDKNLYAGDRLGFSEADLARWFTLWQRARARKAAPPAILVQPADNGDIAKQLVVTGKAATSFIWSNQLPELDTAATKAQLGLTALPGDPAAQWPQAPMYWSIYRGSEHADTAADVINFLVTDPVAGKLLGIERGINADRDVRKAVAEAATNADVKASIAFEDTMSAKFGAPPAPPQPTWLPSVRAMLVTAAEDVLLRRSTPAEAAAEFFTEAEDALTQ